MSHSATERNKKKFHKVYTNKACGYYKDNTKVEFVHIPQDPSLEQCRKVWDHAIESMSLAYTNN